MEKKIKITKEDKGFIEGMKLMEQIKTLQCCNKPKLKCCNKQNENETLPNEQNH